MSTSTRLPGLDSLRAFAIIIVLLYHYMVVVSLEETFGYITQIGWMGVDLFFVLSGYLIGDQILGALARKQEFSIGKFYLRRLLRTLPNYYAVCLLYIFGPDILIGSTTADWWRFLTFTQNFEFRPMTTFSHSWSLCIEEQFYLLAPLLFILAARTGQMVLTSWLIIALGLCLGLGARIDAWNTYGADMSVSNYYHHIYYSSFTRFDELLPGIALAMLKNFHPALFGRLLTKANYWFVLGMLGFSALAYAYPHFHYQAKNYNFFLSTFGYSALAMCFMFMTLAALSAQNWLGRLRIPGAAQLALWSYALYLIHKPLFKLLIEPLQQKGIDTQSWLGASIILALSLLAAWLLFLLVETPFMRLRQRWLPTQVNTAQTAKVSAAPAKTPYIR